MRVLLTGATGFVGSHVLNRLVTRGDHVRVLALPETVEQVRHRDCVSIVAGTLADSAVLAKAARRVEVVYHLGGLRPGYPPQETMRVNVEGTEKLLHACVIGQVRRIVFTSSASVYDGSSWPLIRPITEDFPLRTNSSGIVGHYAQSKIAAESAIRRFQRQQGPEYVILRSPVIYGSGTRSDRQLLMQIINRPALARAAQFADIQWVHVKDMAEAIVLAGTRPKAANNIFNIAGSEALSLRDLSAMFWRSRGFGAWFDLLPHQICRDRNHRLRYDFSKAQKLLGYKPQVRLREGIEEIMAVMNYP
jgi:nucleoside-diphosphate-sugar epimerase